ncbi:MAG TPA: glycosyltransferase family 1 protein [Bryobacteraceae bacterium]|nr:glycosyltransferase family 1 protein [Bryobacteraceae bacterium]
MRIALDATPLTITSGGLPRYVTELSNALAREFPDDTYYLISDQPFPMPERAPANLLRGRPPHSAAERRWWLWGIRNAIRQTGAQVFHGTNFEVPYLGLTPSVLTIHDLSPWRESAWQIHRPNEDAGRVRWRTPWLVRLRRAQMILTVSDAVRREVIDHFGASPDRVRAVPLAASSHFRPVPPTSPAPKPFFLFVATLEPRKNVAALIEGWRESRAETQAELVIAGRNRADFEEIAPCDGLHLLGEVSDEELPRLYSDALAFVYPTHYEGFGLPVLEAMQCGCPVITSRDPAVIEVCGGAAIHTSSAREIAEAMRAIAANPRLRNTLSGAGLQRAAAFSWARTARETHEIYRQVLQGS